MYTRRPWIIAGATAIALAGFGTSYVASAGDVSLNDMHQAHAVQLPGVDLDSPGSADSASAGSADSGDSSDSADSAD